MDAPLPDQLVILIASGSQSDALMKHLTREGFHFTVIDSTNVMMQEPILCLLIGFFHPRRPALLDIIRKNCRPYRKFIPTQNLLPGELVNLPLVEARLGGALVYMVNVERFEQL
jgi:uncharacterized protein YaaQ